ncbi:unnamed protein product, partial [Polarella glacialis]
IEQTAKTAGGTPRQAECAALKESPGMPQAACDSAPSAQRRVSISNIEILVEQDGTESEHLRDRSDCAPNALKQDSTGTGSEPQQQRSQRPRSRSGRSKSHEQKLQMFLAQAAHLAQEPRNPNFGGFNGALFEHHVKKLGDPNSETSSTSDTSILSMSL